MTWPVIDTAPANRQSRAMPKPLEHSTPVGSLLRTLRQQARLSQLDLALQTDTSQRHLSCVETGRARPSPALLHILLGALDTPLQARNALFLAAGYAPPHEALPLTDPSLEMVREAIFHVLKANNPAPAIVIDSQWQVLAANDSTALLFELLGLPGDTAAGGLNLLATLLEPGGLGDALLNADKIRSVAWLRASREAQSNPALARLLASLPKPEGLAADSPQSQIPPVLLTRLAAAAGELNFLSTFTTFGMPLDITVASLRIEHLIPADPQTWHVMTRAWEQANAR